MMILPVLMVLTAQDAGKMPEPVKADSTNIVSAPSRSLRSAGAAAAAGLPALATVRVQCTVIAARGIPVSCVPLENNAKPIAMQAELKRREDLWAVGAANAAPAVRVAVQRAMLTRVRPVSAAGAGAPEHVQMIFTETVGASDVVRLGAAVGALEMRDIEMEERPDAALMEAYYPDGALRAGIQARVKASCRVMPDRKFLCRNAELLSPDAAITPGTAGDFRNATYQVLDSIRLAPLSKKSDPVVGRDVEMRISFVLPN